MIRIKLFPFLTDEPLKVSVRDEVITVNGRDFDLSVIPDGYRLLASAMGSDCFVDEIVRIHGDLTLTLKLPVKWDDPPSLRNPVEPTIIEVSSNGPVEIPTSAITEERSAPSQEEVIHD
ncbi:hypothetical protein YA0871_04265 [Pseudomonas paralactis]|jgi:hypothetical protein|uniref:Uncharacterized protein n=1 Tax=Pseudomonas paralactis TaxID=1615673 RepID=A0ABS0UV24_9PSED|nr:MULTISPECIES: hypothetical protein [Pseudomonas]MBC3255617.1 hypothetical protein [Pseudomonas paralactis]MBI6631864.1 hypothetical protein [Pseudomonas paralactis]MQB17872.1 hypothetical protein [Pseudomonas lactis]